MTHGAETPVEKKQEEGEQLLAAQVRAGKSRRSYSGFFTEIFGAAGGDHMRIPMNLI